MFRHSATLKLACLKHCRRNTLHHLQNYTNRLHLFTMGLDGVILKTLVYDVILFNVLKPSANYMCHLL
jgi:hypothetical protein